MRLSKFILNLTEIGELTLSGDFLPFEQDDLSQSSALLQHLYEADRLEMPLKAPAFNAEAAIWATQYLYRAMQLLLRRSCGEEMVEKELEDYTGVLTPAAIYSIDLTLRYLPDLFKLAKGLAPSDILVHKLQSTAAAFPFSSVGIALEEELQEWPILTHSSLRLTYIDRIIEAKDIKRIAQEPLASLVQEQLGDYTSQFWPALASQQIQQ